MTLKHRIFATEFSKVYPLYVQKAERKGRTKEQVDEIICWLTDYTKSEVEAHIRQQSDFETFFACVRHQSKRLAHQRRGVRRSRRGSRRSAHAENQIPGQAG